MNGSSEERNGKARRKRRVCPTSLTYSTDYDTTYLRNVYVNGIRFARANDKDYDDMED